ncbi:hypothetical protein MMPV_004762 [Pyropia vietnamensis]
MGRGAIDDPFHAVREDAERALSALEGAPPPPPGVSPPPAATSAAADIDDLRRAVDVAAAAPSRFGLSAADVGRRRAVVDGLAARLQAVLGGRDRGPGKGGQGGEDAGGGGQESLLPLHSYSASVGRRSGSGGSGGGAPDAEALAASAARENGRFVDAEMATQSRLVASQDAELADLSIAVERIGSLGRVMHAELGEQAALMEDLDDGLDSAGERMRGLTAKLREFAADAGPARFCWIVGLFCLFLLLTLLVFVT